MSDAGCRGTPDLPFPKKTNQASVRGGVNRQSSQCYARRSEPSFNLKQKLGQTADQAAFRASDSAVSIFNWTTLFGFEGRSFSC